MENKEKLSIELLEEIEIEAKRFLRKTKECKKRFKDDEKHSYKFYGTKESGAVKRAALDLKNELTRITQSIT